MQSCFFWWTHPLIDFIMFHTFYKNLYFLVEIIQRTLISYLLEWTRPVEMNITVSHEATDCVSGYRWRRRGCLCPRITSSHRTTLWNRPSTKCGEPSWSLSSSKGRGSIAEAREAVSGIWGWATHCVQLANRYTCKKKQDTRQWERDREKESERKWEREGEKEREREWEKKRHT